MIPNTYVVYKEISRMIIKVELFFFSLNDWKYTNKACTDNLSKTMHINRNCTHFVHFKKATFTNKFNKFNKLNEILFPYVRFTHTQYNDISYKVENMSLWGPDPPPPFLYCRSNNTSNWIACKIYKNYLKESLTYRAVGYEKYFHTFLESHLLSIEKFLIPVIFWIIL